MNINQKLLDKLFNKLKDCYFFSTMKNGTVRINPGRCRGEWWYVSNIINPKAGNDAEVAQEFFDDKKAAKDLRTRIAAWRKDNPAADLYCRMWDGRLSEYVALKGSVPVTILVVEGDEMYEEEFQGPITAKLLLTQFRKDREDPDDWDITDDETVAGIRTVQLIDCVEGESMKYMWVQS